MEKVITGAIDSYDIKKIKAFVERGFRETGLTVSGRVLLKPNLLCGRTPDRAVTTHPTFVAAVIEFLKDYSCTVYLGDSPGHESLERVLKIGQYTAMLKHLGVSLVPFTKKIARRIKGVSPYHEFVFGEDPDQYNHIINLPKLKTHVMMGMTLAVKNTFGFVRGFGKGRWHMRAGSDETLFASILVDIHRLVNPSVSILDGILGMSGNGPSNGTPANLGIIAFSRDAMALDDVIEKYLCPDSYHPLTDCLKANGLLGEYEVIDLGTPPAPPSFPMPDTCATDGLVPAPVKRLIREIIIKKPKLAKKNCQLCGVCARVCPARAIKIEDKSLKFDYVRCIRCYCCQEMCPHNAIKV